jgi:hypothetical protein
MAVTTALRKARTTPYEVNQSESVDWARIAASGSLLIGGLLLLSGKKRAGLVVAASGTALALLDHEDTLRRWWESVPQYVDQAHSVLDHVQEVVDKVGEKSQSVRRILKR